MYYVNQNLVDLHRIVYQNNRKEYLRLDSLRRNTSLKDYYSMLCFVEKGTCIDGDYHGILRERKL